MPSTPQRSSPARPTQSSTRLRTLGAIAIATVCAVAAACSGSAAPTSAQCKASTDCASGQACVAGACAAKSGGTGGGGGLGTSSSSSSTTSSGATSSGTGGGGASPGCTSNADCSGKGTYWICRKGTHACANLESAECGTIVGDATSDDALLIGAILPTMGPDATLGVAETNAIELAMAEITAAKGLPSAPGTMASRPIVLVGCNDNGDGDTAVKAATHLVNDVGVPAIVGGAFSGVTLRMANTVTIPGGVLLFSPSATSSAITSLVDKSLVWRTAPSDTLQSTALALYMVDLEAKLRADLNLAAGSPINVAIAHKGDVYGTSVAMALEEQLSFNGKMAADQAGTNYLSLDYGDPDDPATDPPVYAKTVASLAAFQPHVVFVIGTTEGVVDVFEGLEQALPAGAGVGARPYYVFSDAGEVSDLWTYIAQAKASSSPGSSDLRTRVSGTVPGTTNANYQAFLASYAAKFKDGSDPTIFGAAGAYDIAYLLSYAAVSLADKPITGPSLATGISRLLPPATTLAVGPAGIKTAFAALQVPATNINLDGASGPLDFDVGTGDVPSDLQIWCIPADPSGSAIAAKSSGYYFDSLGWTLLGAPNWGCQ